MRYAPDVDLRIDLSSLDEANSLASFAVKLPWAVPPNFELASFEQRWPDHINEGGRRERVHADYVLATYLNEDKNWIHVIQGFTARFFGWSLFDPPSDSNGKLTIQGKPGVWLTAHPVASSDHGKFDWIKGDFAYVGWLDWEYSGANGELQPPSPSYYGIASDILDVSELTAIAESVP
jgi:hypothetical protein